jgi:antitoxin (DNA-binding transcriptional repressor) of toxin-antitoxin stability system
VSCLKSIILTLSKFGDLIGFLKTVESGEEIAVLNRSKVIARLNSQNDSAKRENGIEQLLETSKTIHTVTKTKANALSPSETYKSRYFKDAAAKYGIS